MKKSAIPQDIITDSNCFIVRSSIFVGKIIAILVIIVPTSLVIMHSKGGSYHRAVYQPTSVLRVGLNE
jgi:hypothetical protein